MTKKFKQLLSNQKGFTLIEILVVISIIAILFVTLLPQIDFAGDKARQTGVKTDFHTLQVANESYMRETAAKDLKTSELNSYLDKGMKVTTQVSAKQDPWGKEYDVKVYPSDKVIVAKSTGKDGATGGGDDYILATYYVDGVVGTCTFGFETNNVVTDIVADKTKCGIKAADGIADLGTPEA